jgi:hypothetical protein
MAVKSDNTNSDRFFRIPYANVKIKTTFVQVQ